MYLLFKKILLSCLMLTAICAGGQVRFTASLSPSVIARGEYTTIRFTLENATDIRNITPPSFADVVIISGPMQESGSVSINGKNSGYVAISFVITTKNPGKFRLPGAVADVGGKKYTSNAVELQVKKAGSKSPGNTSLLPPAVINLFESVRPATNSFNDYIFRPGDNIAEKVNKNMHLKLEVNKTSCYVGEPLVATYKLYTRLKSESKLSQNPSFNGFSVIDLQAPDVTGTSIEKLNGRDYNMYVIRKAQLYPLQDGTIQLESAELENKVQFIRENYLNRNPDDVSGAFDAFANEMVSPEGLVEQSVVLRSKPVNITVKPLPAEGKPVNFKGAVGDFAIEAGLENNSFTTNESGKLIVMISGSGNLQLITPPVVSWPNGMEAFEPGTSDILSMTSVPVSGKKIFEYPFSVDVPGNYILPAVSFSYFDPKKHSYQTVTTKAIPFTVIKGRGAVVQEKTDLPVKISSPWYNDSRLLLIISGILISGLIVFLLLRKSSNKKVKETIVPESHQSDINLVETSAINQQNPLQASEKCLYNDECSAFYSLLMSDIKTFLAYKFSIPADEINKKNISEKMDKAYVSNDTVLEIQKLMQDIEWQLYTPFERNEKMTELYQRSHELLQMINTYTVKHQ